MYHQESDVKKSIFRVLWNALSFAMGSSISNNQSVVYQKVSNPSLLSTAEAFRTERN